MKVHPPPADIHLEPSDWFLAPWRNLPPLAKGTAAPFNLDNCRKRLSKIAIHKNGDWGWSKCQIPHWMTADEARFWLAALLTADAAESPETLLSQVEGSLYGSSAIPPAKEMPEVLRNLRRGMIPELLPVLYAVFDSATYAQILGEFASQSDVLIPAFRQLIRPYLTAEELAAMRPVVEAIIAKMPRGKRAIASTTLGLASSLGLCDLVSELLTNWQNLQTTYGDEHLIATLGQKDKKKATQSAGGLYYRGSSEYIRGIIAHLEEAAVPFFADRFQYADRDQSERLITEFGRIRRPSMAIVMIRRQLGERRSAAASRWLEQFPELACIGLMEHLDDPTVREAILQYFCSLIRLGKDQPLESALATIAPQKAQQVRVALQTTVAAKNVDDGGVPEWFPSPLTQARLPKWCDVSLFPPILADEKPLPAECMATVLVALRDSTLAEPRALIAVLKKHADARSLDAFALAVFERWLSACNKFEERWAICVLGLLGGDRACLRLEQIIPSWSGALQRAELAIECLQAINSDQALASLAALSKLNRFASASTALAHMGQQRHLTPDQVEDCAIPTLGLQGSIDIRFGSRRFELGLTPDLKPCLLDEQRHRCLELPADEVVEDPHQAELAQAQWATFGQQVNDIIPAQRLRLELAMRGQRRWRADFFQRQMLRHPLLGHFVRAIVWGIFEDNRLLTPFRVTHGGFVDIASTPLEFAPDASVGIVHPTHLTAEERMIWSDVLAENDLTPPFVQLAREPLVVPPANREARTIDLLKNRVYQGSELGPHLAQQGWLGHHYYTQRVWKFFPASRQWAIMELISKNYSDQLRLHNNYGSTYRVTINWLFVTCPPEGTNNFTYAAKNRLKLGEIDPMVYDELVRTFAEFPEIQS
jgi:hypothetical protein